MEKTEAMKVASSTASVSDKIRALDAAGYPRAEIAKLLGVSRQRVGQLAQQEGFPEPVARLAAGPIWDAGHVESWARDTGRID